MPSACRRPRGTRPTSPRWGEVEVPAWGEETVVEADGASADEAPFASPRWGEAGAPAGAPGEGEATEAAAFPAASAAAVTGSPSTASTAIGWFTGTSCVPAGTRMRASVPSSTASYSIVALSVSISAMMSPERTLSPSFFSHLARLPFSIVGDSAGIRMLIGMKTLSTAGAGLRNVSLPSLKAAGPDVCAAASRTALLRRRLCALAHAARLRQNLRQPAPVPGPLAHPFRRRTPPRSR